MLTHAATEEFHAPEAEFDAAGGEIETVTRGENGWLVACAYVFQGVHAEELIATREW
ncbi:DUF5713 family protein [Nocardia sp. NPDC051833]|uniref:DUF5713 family protein n=1 Tax=Nocardia sp. NPDC051833 TaxID=3155674 RepID=UPI00343AD8A5